MPFSVIDSQPYGAVTVTSQIQAVSTNLSARSPAVTVNWAFDVMVGDSNYGLTINGEAASDYSGYAVANAGDVNGDGYDDFVINGVVTDVGAISNAGRSYVLFGGSQMSRTVDLSSLTVAGNSQGFVVNGQGANFAMGAALSGGGDINGDGLADLIVGSPAGYAVGGGLYPNEIAATFGTVSPSFVVFGKSSTSAVDLSALSAGSNTNGFMIATPSTYAAGWSVTDAGDINGDGLDDVALTAPGYNGRAGQAYVVYGKTSGTTVQVSSLNSSTDGFVIDGGSVGGTVSALVQALTPSSSMAAALCWI